jgi:hypothetical protein
MATGPDGEARVVDPLDGQVRLLVEPQLAGELGGVRDDQVVPSMWCEIRAQIGRDDLSGDAG